VDVRVHRLDRGLVRDFGVGMDRGDNASREHEAYEERTWPLIWQIFGTHSELF
jgi:hypothetical protein